MYGFHSAMGPAGLAKRLSEAPPGAPVVDVNGKRVHSTVKVGRNQDRDSVTGQAIIPDAVHVDGEPVLSHSAYLFHLGKKNRLAVVASNKEAPFRALRDALAEAAVMSAIVYDKGAMARVAEAIRTSSDSIIDDSAFRA